jgi:hypothetical protein
MNKNRKEIIIGAIRNLLLILFGYYWRVGKKIVAQGIRLYGSPFKNKDDEEGAEWIAKLFWPEIIWHFLFPDKILSRPKQRWHFSIKKMWEAPTY